MWLMLQQDHPDDYVISSGETHSVREFTELAFKELGIDIEWHGKGVEEYGIDKATGKVIVKVDLKFYRPTEGSVLLGKSEKAEKMLHWKPKISFKDLIKIMVEADYKRVLDERSI
jgi:GDPmannose 4,6-dehydratase